MEASKRQVKRQIKGGTGGSVKAEIGKFIRELMK